jgi:hypothetical protein
MQPNFPALKKIQRLVMDDLCSIYTVTRSSGTYGNNVETRAYSYSGTACGIRLTNGQIMVRGQLQFVEYDAILRVSDDVIIHEDDEIDLIEKGQFQISGTFKPYSAPVVNSSVQHITLKRQIP